MTEYLAHLDRKTGERVLCGPCGAEICKVRTSSDSVGHVHIDRHLLFEEGWHLDREGIWRLALHAARRLKHGQWNPARHAREPKSPQVRRAPVRFLGGERGRGPYTPRSLPATARCWRCSAINLLDPDRLRIVVVKKGQISRGLFPEVSASDAAPL